MRYVSLGDVPAKRHAQTRRNGTLLTEEVLGYEGFSRQRVDPLPPALAVPAVGGRRVHARSCARSGCPTPTCTGWPTPTRSTPGGDADQRPAAADVQRRHRGLDLQADRGPRGLLPQRRGRRGRLRPPRRRRAAHDVRAGALPREGLRRHPARDDPPLAPGRGRRAVLGLLPHARRDRDAQPLPQPLRPAARARAVLPARLPRPDRARDDREPTASSSSRCASATATRATCSTATRSTSSAGTATSTRTRSTRRTSSRAPGASTCRRPRTRPSRARTSSSARSRRGCSTGTRRRCRSPTTTRTSSPRRSCSTPTATTPRARAWRSAA